MHFKALVSILISFVFFSSCSNKNDQKKERINPEVLKQHLVNTNKIVVHNESGKINNYIKARQWNMVSTGTGLRYMIYHKGEGSTAVAGQVIKLKYSVELLDSTKCYSAEENDPVEFVVNQSEQIRGLHEVALYLKKGDKARAILPPHLAYGIAGDNNKIPKQAILVFDLEVLDIKNH